MSTAEATAARHDANPDLCTDADADGVCDVCGGLMPDDAEATDTPTITPGAKVRVQVCRQWAHGVYWPGGWYVGTLEAVRENPEADRYPNAWTWCYVVRTRKGDTVWATCAPECVRA